MSFSVIIIQPIPKHNLQPLKATFGIQRSQALMNPLLLAFLILAVMADDDNDNDSSNGNSKKFNTQSYRSNIDSSNVAQLSVVCNITVCGSATTTPVDLKDGTVMQTDFGGCIGRYNVTSCTTVWQRNITDYGFAVGYYARAGMIFKGGLAVGGTASYKNLLTPGIPNVGAWAFAVNVTDGSLKWKTQVSTHIYAIITQDFLLDDDSAVVGISSGEAAAPLVPGYQCCSFVGSTVKLAIADGSIHWNTPNIPPALAGVGKYSGAASWGGRAIRVGAYIYQVSGQLYQETAAAAACSIADPHNASCTDRDVLFDSVIKMKRSNGEIVASFRASAADVWNIACFFGGAIPGCQGGPSYDFDITNVMYSIGTRQIIATSKSGWAWFLDLDLNLVSSQSVVAGSASGGMAWHAALVDSHNARNVRVFISNNNGAKLNLTLLDGTVVKSGAWAALDGHGQVKWITPSVNDNAYGSLAVSNDVVFGATRFGGLLTALKTTDGSILKQWASKGSMIAAPLIMKNRLVWSTGPGNILGAGLTNQNQLLVLA